MQTKTLFSHHYLQKRLPDHPEWDEDPRPVFEAVRELWRHARQHGDTWNEAQTEQEFVRPALELLGWAYVVQPKAHQAGSVKRPDYALFPDERAKDEAMPHQGDDDAFYAQARAIAEAKYWGRPLSHKDAGGRETWDAQGNPSHQMVSYLVGTHVPWGVLTNGVTWRLYSREVSSTASEFYEVDLGLVFDFLPPDGQPSAAQLDQFRRWWLFFRRASFEPDAQGRSFVRRVHEGSATYARQISAKLKELVFEQVMPEIGGGFVAYRHHQLDVGQESEESLSLIYRASLSLLYKLLFLLYGEARALLPVTNPGYREQSLTRLAQWAAERLDRHLPLSDATHATPRYDALLALFHRIDRGDPSLGIPRYNGGLFDPTSPENQFLEQHKLSDRAVARAVDILVRDAGEPVDYAYIGVRNLGSIYEGLLENRLRVIDAAAGEVELVSDRGERKATGSYYTPDYIVEYIVRHTLDPVLEQRDGDFRAAMDRVAQIRRRLKSTADPTANRLLRQQLDEAERDAREAFLGIKALDPAMGSGHFLVNAVDHLTDGIIRRMQVYHDQHPDVSWEWNPIQRLIERVRGDILAEMARQGIQVDPARLDDTALLTRLVMKRCIYGVDLNRMAVELAKVSLWLHTFTVGAPLSFLDHHLRWGNSLIGSDVRTVEREIQKTEAGQLSLWQGPFAGLLDLTGLMVEVVERADATLADVRQSARDFDRFREELTPYKQVLDLWVSQHFGNQAAGEFLTVHGEDVLPALKGQRDVPEKYEATIARARALWQEKRFFHWDLEFPEVFVDLRKRDWAENPGFDAVVGNPPWGAGLSSSERGYFDQAFETSQATLDSFAIFCEQGKSVLSIQGWLGYILPSGWQTGKSYAPFRKLLLKTFVLRRIVNLPYDIFPDAYVDSAIVVLEREDAEEQDDLGIITGRVGVLAFDRREKLSQIDDGDPRLSELDYAIWFSDHLDPNDEFAFLSFLSGAELAIAQKIASHSVPMRKIAEVQRGITPFHLVDEKLNDAYGPALDGELRRYYYQFSGRKFVKYDESIAEYKPPRFFTGPRVVLRELISRQFELQAVLIEEDFITNKSHQSILLRNSDYHLGYLLALLNSLVLSHYHIRSSAIALRDDFPKIVLAETRELPIRRIAFTTPPEKRERLVGVGTAEAAEFVAELAEEGVSASSVSFSEFSGSKLGRWIDERLTQTASGHTQSDVIHDLLAHLAQRMIDMHQARQRLERALDPFKYLDRGAPFVPLPQALADEIKYGELVRTPETDLGAAHHDVDGLRLVRGGAGVGEDEYEGWELQVQLKKRDPEDGWRSWQYEERGNQIARAWVPVYRLPLSEEKARYYQHALQVLGEFAEAGSFPGGYTRSTMKKLQLTRVPAFDPEADLAPLVELSQELTGMQTRIAAADRLIDLIVYRLYGLTEEEVAVVEGRGSD
jgi:hypothetical protein